MKTIRILHLFPRLLSLYGEYGNPLILKKLGEENGINVEIESYEGGELILEGFDLIYIGSGTERAVELAVEKLSPFAVSIKKSVESGTLWLCTGTAPAIFGEKIVTNEKQLPALGIFPYSAECFPSKRYAGDALSTAENPFGAELVGYINTSYVFSGISSPLDTLCLGTKLGNTKQSGEDGFACGSFFATQLIGPFLVKNPAAAGFFLSAMAGEKLCVSEDSDLFKAYSVALKELRSRV